MDDSKPRPVGDVWRDFNAQIKRDDRICAAITKRATDYRIEAARKLVDAGFDPEGDIMDADEYPIAPIPGEIPGAWVPVYVWVNARDLPPKRRPVE